MSNDFEDIYELSIGQLASLTGFDVHRLRMWERRYGMPHSRRLPSGHRRYKTDEVSRLRLVRMALDMKLRPAQVVPASVETLEQLLSDLYSKHAGRYAATGRPGINDTEFLVETLAGYVTRYDADAFLRRLHDELSVRGPFRIVCDLVGPFVSRIGDGWLTDELSVGHEHFATNLLNDFLGTVWQRLNERCAGGICVLATLPGERHVLGLQMCAVVTALAGRRVIYLGADMPEQETVRITNKLRPQALCLSLSTAMPKPQITLALRQLRSDLDGEIAMITGGKGAVDGLTGIERIVEFEQYMQRLNTT